MIRPSPPNRDLAAGAAPSVIVAILVLLAILVIVATLAISVAPCPALGASQHSNVDAHLDFPREGLKIETDGSFHEISYEGSHLDYGPLAPGCPQLPMVSKLFLLPDETAVSEIHLRHVAWDTLPGRYRPKLVPGEPDTLPASEAWPDPFLRIVRDGYLRGYHLAQLLVYPVRFLPQQEKLILAREVHISLELRSLSAEESDSLFRILRPTPEDQVMRWILDTVENPEQLAQDYPSARSGRHKLRQEESSPYGGFRPTQWPSLQGPPVEQVIITDDHSLDGAPVGDLTAVFETYAHWKTERGVPTVVERVRDISLHYEGFDLVEKIKAYLEAAVRDWGVKWILLGGDVQIVPTRRLDGGGRGGHSRPDPPADIYYVRFGEDWNLDDDPYLWNGFNDLGPLVSDFDQAWVGRLPCRSALEAEVMTQKIRSYLGDSEVPHPSDYYESVLLATGPVNSMSPRSSSSGYSNAEEVILPFREVGWPDTVRLYADVDKNVRLCDSTPEPCYEDLHAFLDSLDVTPWRWDGLQDHLNRGYHIVWHLEHCIRQFLGGPTVTNAPPLPEGCEDQDWARLCERDLAESWGGTRELTKEQAFELQNGPRYSIIVSGGSFTNEFDLDAVSEALLRSPRGGAVAYIGKTLSLGGYGTGISRGLFENILHGGIGHVGQALSLSIALDVPSELGALRSAYQFPLLGDPEMVVWSRTPSRLEIDVEPLTSLGLQPIEVLVRDESSGLGVADARVCLKQADVAYGVQTTDLGGRVVFPGFPVLGRDPIQISVTAPDFLPLRSQLDVNPSQPHVVYDSHIIQDIQPRGDGGGEPEAGETVHLRVIGRNLGGRTAEETRLTLHPTAPVRLDLRIDGEPATGRVVVGSSSSRPPGASFVIPPAGDGFRTEGEPLSAWRARYRFWREEDGSYILDVSSLDQISNEFVGTLTTVGSFSDVALSGEAEDQLFWEGDSIWFRFLGDGTRDRLTFRAEAKDWIELDPVGGENPPTDLDPGDTLSLSRWIRLRGSIPDGFTMPFTLSAFQDDSIWSHSDFALQWRAPLPELLFIEESPSLEGLELNMMLRPVVRNVGQGEWQSLKLVMRKLTGEAEVTDSVSTIPRLGPGEVSAPSDSMVLHAYTMETLRQTRYELWAQVNLHSDLAFHSFGPCDASGVPLEAPRNLNVHSAGRGFVLTWDPVVDADRYAVHHLPAEGTPRFLGFAVGASRFDATHVGGSQIESTDTGDMRDHRFQVRACRAYRCGGAATSSPDRVWIPQAESWPRLVPGGVTTAPKILPPPALGDRGVIFAAGRSIYAWFDDGSPLRSGEEFADGLFFDPDLPARPRRVFTEALALFQFAEDAPAPSHMSWGLAGNVPGVGLIVLRLVPEEDGIHWRPESYWTQPVSSSLAAPVIWPLLDANRPHEPQILLPADDDTLHAWMWDGTPLLTQFPNGAIARIPDGSRANYHSLAIAEACEPFRYTVLQSTRTGRLICWKMPEDSALTTLPDPLWDVKIEMWDRDIAKYTLSAPSVGDVDGDGVEEVVITNQTGSPREPGRPGRIWILDPLTGDVRFFAESDDWRFRSHTGDFPAPRPALANLDGRPGLEIVLSGRVDAWNDYVAEHRVHVLAVRSSEIVELTCVDTPVLPSRNSGNINASIIWRSPVPFDVDGDSRVEILAPSASGALFLWEADEDLKGCHGEAGWPMLFGDVVMPPAVDDLDGDGQWEMAVTSEDGFVHLFELPGTMEHTAPSQWNQYAADIGNSSRVHSVFEFRGPAIVAHGRDPGGFLSVSPTPFRPRQSIRFAVGASGRARLDVFNVAGRRVRTLLDRNVSTGIHEAIWDGRDEGARSVASGIYFYKLQLPGKSEIRRTLLVR